MKVKIIADDQEALDKIPCPKCEQYTLKMTSVLYSCPLQFIAHCTNCVFSERAQGLPIKVLEEEDAIKLRPEWYGEFGARKYPHLYLDSKDPILRKIAEDPDNKVLGAYLTNMRAIDCTKIPYSNRYTLRSDDRGELIEISNGSIKLLDTWRTEQEMIDGANRRMAQSGLGCFPILNICPICNETFSTSSSLPLYPDQYKVIDDKVVHSKCLAARESQNE